MKRQMLDERIGNFQMIGIVALSAALLTSCGSSRYAEVNSGKSSAQSSVTDGSLIPTPTPTPTPTPSPTPTSTDLYPPITTSFTLTGSGGSSPSYSYTPPATDNLLKIRVKAGAATNVIPGSNFSATYECVSFNVTALGQTLSTGTMSVSGGNSICPNAPTTKDLDFSSRLTSGHQSVTITVQATGYDFYCQACLNYPWMFNAYPYGYYSCNLYCPLKTVYMNHGVTGSMNIQINGTSL
jgi:hypothetical protein